ncbi:B- and T-lymphocyte attenuator isoform X2 [Oreochromis niloticus]|uniref:B- and T-lymphocyte attenuator isoform X2 n=1 Tax=Oreochromis niloticus TaxID=8128 RepID=UPI000DF335FB|nr:B- and T-lymphocyte attenuator isoform X2 [Oreochromis niloticus]CAI5638270.1 unnamed protein product [Mustela putorius furo]
MSAMKHYSCRTILYSLIFTVLILTPDAQSDSDCSIEIRVRRNTVHNASAGQQLWINCPVIFCNDSPPTVTWYKVEETIVPINVSGDSHIITAWKHLNKSAGISYLIFQNILRNDSGQYQCQVQGGRSMSHAITVNVYDHNEITTVTQNNVRGDSDCSTEIKVRRNTVYNASAGQQLWINCPVFFCNDSPPTVSWYKVEETGVPVNVSGDSHIKTEWKHLDKPVGIFYLIFRNILKTDSGQYQCRGGGSVSYAITVNVYDHSEIITVTQNNVRVSTTSAPDNTENLLLYVYSAAGVTSFVIIVIIISVISMRGCKGKPKKDSQAENQQMEIPMVDQFFSKVIFKHLERGSPSALRPRRCNKETIIATQ